MISLIIPVYNVEQYLSQCLDTILNQTYSDFEVILINDGSKDNSGNICDKYAEVDSRVRVIHQSNSGVSIARNRGILEARGEWIAFIDSDDFIDTTYLEDFDVDICDADIVIQGFEYFNHNTGRGFNKIQMKNEYLCQEDFIRAASEYKLLENGYPFGKLFRRKTVLQNNIKFDTTLSFHEDHIFVLEYLCIVQKIILSDSISYKYRCYHTNKTLSSQSHSWHQLSLSSDRMIALLNRLRHKFLLPSSSADLSAYHFAYSAKVSAVNELFRVGDKFTLTKKNYYHIIDKNELCTMYRPLDFKGKLYRFIMLSMPYIFIFLFFRTLVKYQNRKK